jgi:hypothetical protein
MPFKKKCCLAKSANTTGSVFLSGVYLIPVNMPVHWLTDNPPQVFLVFPHA